MLNTAGIYTRKNKRATSNAPVIQKMIDAGCIVLCTTNTSEGCIWLESHNYLTGRTNNPYNSKHTSGLNFFKKKEVLLVK